MVQTDDNDTTDQSVPMSNKMILNIPQISRSKTNPLDTDQPHSQDISFYGGVLLNLEIQSV